MTPGLLSVVMGNYNHAEFVAGQIHGILTQDFKNFEFIILDDASTDNSVSVIEDAIKGDSRARLIRNEKNLGAVMNQEKGRALAQGEFLYYAAADDRVLPGFFEKSVKALTNVPEAGVCFSVMAWLDGKTMMATPMPMKLVDKTTFLNPDAFCEVICGEHITGHTSMMRKAAYEATLPPVDDFKQLAWAGDWFVSTVIACRQGVCHVPEPLVAIRETGANYGHGMYDWEKQQHVVGTVLKLLKTDAYRDCIPYFAKGALLSGIPFVGKYVLSHPELWDVETLMITQKSLVDWALERTQKQQSHWKR